MTTARTEHTSNTVLGAGELFIDVYSNDAPTGGERYVGDSVGATISVTSERTTIQSGDGAVAQDLVDIVRSVSRTMGFTLRDSSIANWALFLIGKDPASAQAAAAEAALPVVGPCKAGYWYQIGSSAANPGGVGKITPNSDAPVTMGTASSSVETAATEGTDYELDADTGRLKALVDGFFKVTGAVVETTKQAQTSEDVQQITCALRYVETNPATAGKGRNVYVRKCNLVPGGEAALKSRDTEQQMAFTATVQEPSGGWPALTINGVEA